VYELLLSPAKIGPWELTSHVVMSPLTRSRAEEDWSPSRYAAEYYGQRGGAGIVICEATQVSPDATGYPRTPGIWTDAHVRRWREIVDAIHAGGARAVLQLWHCGRIGHPDNMPKGLAPMGPSAVQPKLPIYTDVAGTEVTNPMPREMNEDDIQGVIESYRSACRRAKEAGFDGVELHGANGYIVEQFVASNTNLRTDKWGGSLANRVRFMAEVLKAMTSVYEPSTVGVRLSPFGRFNEINDENPQAMFEAMLGVAEASGVGYVHVIRPVVSGNVDREASASDTEVIRIARKLFSRTVIAAAAFTPDTAEAELASGRADLIAFGRPFIGNPDFVNRLRKDVALSSCDASTFYTPGPKGYIDYSAAT